MSIVYVDTSALLKRAVAEANSLNVREAFRQHHRDGDLVVSSSLAWLEVWRALRRLQFEDVGAGVSAAMSGVGELPLSDGVLRRARKVGTENLRSLDAIHLASAVMVGADSVMTYDDRLGEAVRSMGMTVLSPTE